jgi:hypothetical protein
MAEAQTESLKSQTDEHKDKYYSFQIKAWTNFDPMDKSLTKIADAIEEGGGFLTLVEVLTVEEDLAKIGDTEARECFANILAARRLVKNVHELPKTLLDDLRQALKVEEEVAPKKAVARAAVPSVADEVRVKHWP